MKNFRLFKWKKRCIKDTYYPCSYSTSMVSSWETWERWTGSISIGGRRISDLRYADVHILVALDEEEMVELVNLVEIANKKRKIRINASKTKVMMIDWVEYLTVSIALIKHKKVNTFIFM